MSQSVQNVCQPLPPTITNSATTYESREQFVVRYLEKLLPSSDGNKVLEELKRTFMFDKHKLSRDGNNSKSGGIVKKAGKRKHGRPKILGTGHGLKYTELLGLNEMWLDYMRQYMRVKDFVDLPTSPVQPNWDSTNEKLARADYHGAVVTVMRSKDASTVGMSGIVLLETKNCFTILTTKNRIRTLAKNSSIFKFDLPRASFEVLGSEIMYKPAERSVKKLKALHFCHL